MVNRLFYLFTLIPSIFTLTELRWLSNYLRCEISTSTFLNKIRNYVYLLLTYIYNGTVIKPLSTHRIKVGVTSLAEMQCEASCRAASQQYLRQSWRRDASPALHLRLQYLRINLAFMQLPGFTAEHSQPCKEIVVLCNKARLMCFHVIFYLYQYE